MNLATSQPNTAVILPQAAFIESLANPGSAHEPPEMRCGYGVCSISGCHCQGYMGNDNTCSNCGHNYGSHY